MKEGMSDTATGWRIKAREQFEDLLGELESDCEESLRIAGKAARETLSETLNQGLRRLRLTASVADAASLALELALPFAPRCAVFLFRDGHAEADWVRGFGAAPIRFSPDEAAAFQAAIEAGDPVTAVSIPSEISPVLAKLVNAESTERVYLFPLTVRGAVTALIFAAGEVQAAPLELIAGLTAMQMGSLLPAAAAKREDLISIQGSVQALPQGGAKPGGSAWTELSPDLQALHLRAQRSARLRVAEMRLEHADAIRRGLEQKNLYAALREPIDRAREEFRRESMSATPSMVDYLYLEIVRGLAHENDGLLGSEFPGPLTQKP